MQILFDIIHLFLYSYIQEGNMSPKKSEQKRLNTRGKILINFEVTPEMHDKLRALAIEEDRTISAILRRIIKRHFGLS